MGDNPQLPFFTNTRAVFAIFVLALIVFDLVLIRWWKLRAITWKRVDYFWIGLGALGLMGAVSQARQVLATGLLAYSDEQVAGAYSMVRWHIRTFSEGGGICRTFVRSQWSPPEEEFNRVQREYDATCEWFKRVRSTIAQTDQPKAEEIAWENLPPLPHITLSDLKESVESFRQSVAYYNLWVRKHNELAAKTKRSTCEETLLLLSPVILVVALAIRITKVTAEIKNG